MAQSIYITSTEGLSGKSTIVLGVLDALTRSTPRVGVFRAIARSTAERDYVLEMLLDHIGVDLDYETLGTDNGMLMVTASGTAVRFSPVS